jgi:2-polyprenyl-6-methoxyphenol hydroxylase-like FAD-dependent oxidoreductase
MAGAGPVGLVITLKLALAGIVVEVAEKKLFLEGKEASLSEVEASCICRTPN